MSPPGLAMHEFAYSMGIIGFGLSLGYLIQVLCRRGLLLLPMSIEQLRRLLQRGALLIVNPVAILGAVWVVRVEHASLIALPFVGLLSLVAGGVLALWAARMLRLSPAKTGSLFGCGSFTNIGSVGALVCFVFLGESGFALVPIYKLFEDFYYYAIGFPIAKHYAGGGGSDGERTRVRVKRLAKDPFILTALTSITVGVLLNQSGLERPAFYKTLNSVLVPLGTLMLLASIGLAMRFGRVRGYVREAVVVSVIKFALVPALATAAALVSGFGGIQGGLPLKVVMILAAMPVAFNALIPPSIYDLDIDLANSCWLVTTALLTLVLPVLLGIVSSF
jgi:hypothetical protein